MKHYMLSVLTLLSLSTNIYAEGTGTEGPGNFVNCKVTSLKNPALSAQYRIPFNGCEGLSKFHELGVKSFEERQKADFSNKDKECKDIPLYKISEKSACKKELKKLKEMQDYQSSMAPKRVEKICYYKQEIYVRVPNDSKEANVFYGNSGHKLDREAPHIVIANDYSDSSMSSRTISGFLILPIAEQKFNLLGGNAEQPLLFVKDEHLTNENVVNPDISVNCEKEASPIKTNIADKIKSVGIAPEDTEKDEKVNDSMIGKERVAAPVDTIVIEKKDTQR